MAKSEGPYFGIGAGFCSEQGVSIIGRRLGTRGQWALVRLFCLLLSEDGGRLLLSTEDEWEDLACRLGLEPDACRELMALAERYGQIVRPDGGAYIFAPRVTDGLAARQAVKERARKAIEARWAKQHEADTQADTDVHTVVSTDEIH